MKKFKILFLSLTFIILPSLVLAQPALDKLKTVGETNGPYENVSDPQDFLYGTVGNIISIFSAILAIIFIILIILAGYHYMTAQGDENKVSQSFKTIYHAVIGLVIVISSYAITMFILNRLT